MSNGADDSGWTSSHKEKLADEKIDENKIMDRGQQKQFDVPVHSDTSKIPLDIWEIDIDKVSYNFDNIRIGKYKKRHCFKLGIDELDQENPEHQKVVQEILLNTEDYGEKTTVDLKADLVLKGQEDPALITEVGVLWNGNRRCAAMREMFENPPAGGLGKLTEGRIKVCFLPEGLSLTKLKILEKRLQQTADTKQEYGRLNQMYDIWKTLDLCDFEVDYQNPTTEEKEEILRVIKTSEFESWGMIEHAKETLDLMDDYLDSRHTEARPLIGNYDVIEIPGKTTWFEDVRKLLRKVRSHWDDPDIEGDPEDKYDAYKTWAFTTYDQVDSKGKSTADWRQIRKIAEIVDNATGAGGPRDTTSLLDAFEKNSIIINEWSELSQQEEHVSLSAQTRTVRGEEVSVKELENQNLETTADQVKQHGEDPKLLLDKLLRQIKNIDLNLVQKNDKDLLDLIEKCKVELKKIEEQATD